MRPYIGITDFTIFSEVSKMLEFFIENRKYSSDLMLHVGVMMSYKTLNGIHSQWSSVFPQKEKIRKIFAKPCKDIYYCLHYADYNNDTKPDDIKKAISFAGEYVNAIQFDMVWPTPNIIEIAKGFNIETILQVGSVAFDAVHNKPEIMINKLRGYEGLIDRVLLDKSMGRGIRMDPDFLIMFASEIKRELSNVGLVFAGGLGPGTVNLIEPIYANFPEMSIDAQGKLRSSGDARDPIDWGIARRYITESLSILDVK